MSETLLEWQAYEMKGGGWWWWWTDRERGKRNGVVLVRQGGGVGADVVPHLQCSAGPHHPIISQLSVKGAGPAADDSQGEFSVRRKERETQRVCVRKSERESQRACSRTQPQCAACSRASTLLLSSSSPLSALLFTLSLLLSTLFPPLLILFATPSIISAFQLSPLIALSCSSTSLFTLYPFPSFLVPFLKKSSGWWSDFFVHLHSLLSSSLHHVPWASVHLAGKSRISVCVSVGRRDNHRQFQVFLVLQKSLKYPALCSCSRPSKGIELSQLSMYRSEEKKLACTILKGAIICCLLALIVLVLGSRCHFMSCMFAKYFCLFLSCRHCPSNLHHPVRPSLFLLPTY